MPTLANSAQTLNNAQNGNWWTATAPLVAIHVDTPGGRIQVQTRRDSNDAFPKPVPLGLPGQTADTIGGPVAVHLMAIVGTEYRMVCQGGGPVSVAALVS